MHILWIKLGGLWPLDSGGRLRSFHILSQLALRHRITFLTTHEPGDDVNALRAHLPPNVEVLSVPYSIPKRGSVRFVLLLLQSWFSRHPIDVFKFRVPALSRRISRTLEEKNTDVCVADFLSATPNVSLSGSVPVVFFAHNVEHMIWERLSRIVPGFLRPFLNLEWRKMRRYEAKICRQSTATITVSDVDRQRLASIVAEANLSTVPTGVDTAYFTPSDEEELPFEMVFTGSMDWHPNEDAMLHFLDTILPRIRRNIPGASLTVVGRNPTVRLRTRASEAGVHVTGTVDDVRPYIAKAAVYVVPLRIGGGTRLKIFEALAMGKAVVSTAVGAEGLPIIHGEHILQVDEPDQFAHAVLSLMKDTGRRRAVGAAGRHLVETRYSWSQVARQFETRCLEAIDRDAGSAPVTNRARLIRARSVD